MQFQPIYDDGKLLLPNIELEMTSNQSVGIITDLKRKQLLMNQLSDRSGIIYFGRGKTSTST